MFQEKRKPSHLFRVEWLCNEWIDLPVSIASRLFWLSSCSDRAISVTQKGSGIKVLRHTDILFTNNRLSPPK